MTKRQRLTKALLTVALAAMSLTATAQDFETASEAVKNMRVGWNMGNTLDSNSGDTLRMWIEADKNRTVKSYETAWGQPQANPELFKMLKDEGFNAIRVPVTWYPHMEATFNDVRGYDDHGTWSYTPWLPSKDDIGTKIDSKWMARVHEVVDYVLDQGMYCILNIHHDTGAANTAWLIADEAVYEQQHERFEAVWRQIAEEFKDYGERLLFEGYNEMLDIKRSWCFASFGAPGYYNATIAQSAYNAINSYAQSFVDAVRSTGGNNAQRNLIVCTYGACDGSGTWNSHLLDPLKEMKLPTDAVQNHLFFEVHFYPEIDNLSSGKTDLNRLIQNLNTYLVDKGAPVIIGEWGSSMKNKDEAYEKNLAAYDQYLMEQTKANGIATFHWMGISDGSDRSKPKISQPQLVEAMMKGYYGEGGFQTAVHTATTPAETGSVYSITGINLGQQSPDKLRKGLYIINGKKTVVK